MALIQEETDHETGIGFTVTQRQEGECSEPWKIIELNISSFSERITPRELREIGRWLTKQGTRIGKQYKSNGATKEENLGV